VAKTTSGQYHTASHECVSSWSDPAKADIKKIESLSSVKGTFTQAGQFQVIIGNEVDTFYNDFVAVSGIEGVSKEAAKQSAKSNQKWLERAMTNIAEIFAPLIPAIVCGGSDPWLP
jgi:PTS system trehalose-specific IIC component